MNMFPSPVRIFFFVQFGLMMVVIAEAGSGFSKTELESSYESTSTSESNSAQNQLIPAGSEPIADQKEVESSVQLFEQPEPSDAINEHTVQAANLGEFRRLMDNLVWIEDGAKDKTDYSHYALWKNAFACLYRAMTTIPMSDHLEHEVLDFVFSDEKRAVEYEKHARVASDREQEQNLSEAIGYCVQFESQPGFKTYMAKIKQVESARISPLSSLAPIRDNFLSNRSIPNAQRNINSGKEHSKQPNRVSRLITDYPTAPSIELLDQQSRYMNQSRNNQQSTVSSSWQRQQNRSSYPETDDGNPRPPKSRKY